MSFRISAITASVLAATFALPPPAQAEPGYLMQGTTVFKMRWGNDLPPRTMHPKFCMPAKSAMDPRIFVNASMCTFGEPQRSGNTVSAAAHCQMAGGPGDVLEGTTRLTWHPGGHMTGHMHAEDALGRSRSIDLTLDYQRLGSCDYTPPKSH